jgi:hypothetical protein
MQAILDAQLAEWGRRVQAQLGLTSQGNKSGPQQGNGWQNGNFPQNGHGAQHGNVGPHESGNGPVPASGFPAANGGTPPDQPGTPPPASDFGLSWDGGLL